MAIKSMTDAVKLAMLQTPSHNRNKHLFTLNRVTVSNSLAGYWPSCFVRYISEDVLVMSKIDPKFFSLSKPLSSVFPVPDICWSHFLFPQPNWL